MKSVSVTFLLLLVTCSYAAEAGSLHWNQFRGPNGAGVAAGFAPPLNINASEAAWRTPLPAGKSSPVLWGDRIYVTGVESDRLVTMALDAATGRVLWKRMAPDVPLERVHAANSAAASTPCADEDGVYVYFGSYGLLCYDPDGVERWKKPIPTPKSMYGVATSPILHESRLILILDDDANLPDSQLSRSRVMALDKSTGELVWETPRPYNRGGWSSPMIWTHQGGADLIVLGNGRVCGYDPTSGAERWCVRGFAREPIAVPVAGNAQLFVSVSMQGGRGDVDLDPEPFWTAMLHFDRDRDGRIARNEITKDFTLPFRPELAPGHPGFGLPLAQDPDRRKQQQSGLFEWRDTDKDGFWTKKEFTKDMRVGAGSPNLSAIRPGGQGDITDSHVSWTLRRGIPEIPSPIYHADRLYLVRAGGVLTCVDTQNGQVICQERLGAAGQYSASPIIVDNHLLLVSNQGVLTVVKCGDECTVTHQTDLGAPIAATPALDRNSIYFRADSELMAFRRSK
jgi:hypothetical protein